VFSLKRLRFDKIFIGGDLKFTTNKEEIWGPSTQEDILAIFSLIISKRHDWLMWSPSN
jgi:hypothetical protein